MKTIEFETGRVYCPQREMSPSEVLMIAHQIERATYERLGLAVWNDCDWKALETLAAENVVYHRTGLAVPLAGREALKAIIVAFHECFADARVTFDEVILTDERAVVQWTWSGIHRATGRMIATSGVSVQHIVFGKITKEYAYVDDLGILKQAGVIDPALSFRP